MLARFGDIQIDLVRFAVLTNDHLVRVFLSPGERTFRPVDLDRDIVLTTMADLGCRYGAERSVFKLDHGGAVVVQLSTFNERL